jgi:dTDP-D-glucose 4,6-dehydratase
MDHRTRVVVAGHRGLVGSDGSPRKLLDVSKFHALVWRHRLDLREGLASTYHWFLESQPTLRRESAPLSAR